MSKTKKSMDRALRRKKTLVEVRRYWQVYLAILPALILVIIFCYIPLSGLIITFKDYNMFKGFFGSPWAANHGMANIIAIFQDKELMGSIWNTIFLSVLNLLIAFPAPIILALLINELRVGPFKKTVQTISYMPQFLSWIAVVGLVITVFGKYGPINDFMTLLDPLHDRTLYLSYQDNFVPILLGVNLWKTVGWNSIIYISAISSIDPQLYEAAEIDGAGKWNQMRYITMPGLSVTIILLFIMNIGTIFSSNFELIFGLQNPFINFETIDTVIYKNGLMQRGYSIATALGFVRGLIAMGLTLGVNWISAKVNDVSII